MDGPTRQLRDTLLAETLRHAVARSAFYARSLGETVHAVRRVEDLAALPTIDKETLALHACEMLTSAEFPVRTGLSSGTTYGRSTGAAVPGAVAGWSGHAGPAVVPPTVTYQSREEQEVHQELLRRMSAGTAGPVALSLSIHGAHHGDTFLRPAPGTFLAPLEKPFHFTHVAGLLRSRFSFEGCTSRIEYISGSLTQLKLLAFLAIRDDPGLFGECSLKGIYSNGFYVTRRWRGFLENAYRTPLTDIFGISEIAGANCTECQGCGGFHLPPFVIPEVLTCRSQGSPDEQFGELVLTSLYPFTQMQPLIRYRTGDLVKVLPQCPLVDDLGFRPFGRLYKSVIDPSLGVLLPSACVMEAVDEFPEVARSGSTLLQLFRLDDAYGTPKYEVTSRRESGGGRNVVRLVIELVFHPQLYPERAKAIEASLAADLARATAAATKALQQGRLVLEVSAVSPGTLAVERDTFPDRD